MMPRLCIVGVGLIGGSIARAARMADLCGPIIGIDAHADNLQAALDLGVIDQAVSLELFEPVAGDRVVLATPVGAMEQVFNALRASWCDAAIYTDVGSTKCNVIQAAARTFGKVPANFIPGHPIAGAEQSGVTAARSDLFVGKRVILTPVAETSLTDLALLTRFWHATGATVSQMTPIHHDEVLAATSHLPHMLAFALTELLGRMDAKDEIFQYAAGGFRDFTRIASSDPRMWTDIALANQSPLLTCLASYQTALQQLMILLQTGNESALHQLFTDARAARERFLQLSEK